jgi:hypothetical protein
LTTLIVVDVHVALTLWFKIKIIVIVFIYKFIVWLFSCEERFAHFIDFISTNNIATGMVAIANTFLIHLKYAFIQSQNYPPIPPVSKKKLDKNKRKHRPPRPVLVPPRLPGGGVSYREASRGHRS